ncbi:bifunctional copper resistance protein CopD/cytochrome c oxidase assembly protein [Cellulosimicrobium sp. XJ-DQ-B-000]|uniref:bifunctional copper resistance protein CopD/cytochrome c oxidase assembly protein n=1 Tax=Cellulosimicrobium sp. XJ-DQ-B-000 TaxID=3072182 RepID=UPI00280685F8|nr:bifunctional copper resistance protein CopD/cytochrome c oxidase assembly protein [Cellulosimicrobium sp. XJ-DQ-B-000]MDQ8041836.1 bifunctional copper resistance protein CopD/cytochrome c oxidase assembly protein [Cellulosimicrobium sp. XJ-DQ-B-000]
MRDPARTDNPHDVPHVEGFHLPRLRPSEIALLGAIPLAVLVALVGLAWTGELAPKLLADPGDVVRYGLPVARVVHDGAAALTIGLLVLAVGVLPGQGKVPGAVSYSQWTATRWAARAAAVWLAAAIAVVVFTTGNSVGMSPTDPGFWDQVHYFAIGIELGQFLAVSTLLVAGSFLVLLGVRTVNRVAVALVLALAALLPVALGGHAAGADEHRNAVNSLLVHLVAVTVWVGGLAGLALLRPRVGTALPTVVARYSVVAAWCFAGAAFSGIVNASLRLESPADLVTSTYGLLLTVKVVALVALGLAGWAQRRRIIPRLAAPDGGRAFARLAVGEILVMAVTFGASVALSRSSPPVPQEPVTYDPRHALLGFPYPEPVSARTMLTAFQPDWLFLAVAATLAGLYLAAVVRLHRRGDRWPVGRTAMWVLGCVALAYATSGGPGVYGSVHFSTHMIQHMALMMFVPLPLALGAPVSLALRALPPRSDHSRGPREWILLVVHSWYSRVLTRPAVAGVIFAGSLVAFYYTGWFQYALFEHPGHLLMQVHFLLSGYLFFWVILGIDPGPTRAAYPVRLLILLVTMAFHAFFGIAVMADQQILAADWWAAMGYSDTEDLLEDQAVGGSITWGAGEIPVLIAAIVVAVQWARDDERTARRRDRQADRDGDAELAAYNDHLAELARRGT